MSWQRLNPEPCELGESPFWHPQERMLYWVDIAGKKILRTDVAAGHVQTWAMPSEPGCIAPARNGGLVIALRHGIFQERQSEFVTDALRAQLLEWAGYRTKVFEFIATDHTAKNLMIAGIKSHEPGDATRAARLRAFAAFYGIRTQRLAAHLNLPLAP